MGTISCCRSHPPLQTMGAAADIRVVQSYDAVSRNTWFAGTAA